MRVVVMAGGFVRAFRARLRALVGEFIPILPPSIARRVTRGVARQRPAGQEETAADYYAQAHVFASRGEYESSIRACRASIALKPDNIAAYEVLTQILTHTQQYDDALEACAEGFALKPDSASMIASLRRLLPLADGSNQTEKVIAALQKCLAVSPACGDVLAVVVQMLVRSGRYVEVVEVCQRALAADPEYLPAAETIRNLMQDPVAKQALAGLDVPDSPSFSNEYDWLVASNVTDALLAVMLKFYAALGIDSQTVPLVQGLERWRRKLAAERPETYRSPAELTLVSFERAWSKYQAGQTRKALTAFASIVNDDSVLQRAAFNPLLQEAVVRSGEILGRHYDKLGEAETAIGIYRKIMSVDLDSIIARRLTVLLSRNGRLSEAAEFAEAAIVSRPNLFRRIPFNRHIAELKAELALTQDSA